MLEYADDVIVDISEGSSNTGLSIWGNIVGQLSAQTDLYTLLSGSNQTLFYDESANVLTISNGNTVNLSALSDFSVSTFASILSTRFVNLSGLTITTNLNVSGNATVAQTVKGRNIVSTVDTTVGNNLRVSNDVNVGGTIYTGLTTTVLGTYYETIGDGNNTDYFITHNLNTRDVSVVVRDLSSNLIATPTIQAIELSSIKLSFINVPSVSAYGVSIFAGVPSTRVAAYGLEIFSRKIANVLYVTVSGNDENSGTDPYFSLRTIKKACEIAHNARVDSLNDPSAKFTIMVGTGDFVEENPVYVPSNTSIIGDNLRRCSIIPKNKQFDIFWMDNSSYAWGFTFREHLEPAAGAAFPVLSNPLLTSIAFKNLYTPFVRRTLEFDREKCKRDIGYILSAVEVDIINGNNNESVVNGQFYYNGVISVLPSNQITPTNQAIERVKNYILANIATPDTFESITITFNTITNIISGGSNNYTSTSFTPGTSAFITAQAINAQKTLIQQDALNYLDTLYPAIYKWRKPFITTSPYVQGASSITRALNATLQKPVQVFRKFSTSVPTSGLLSLSSVEASFNTVISIVSGGVNNYSNLTYLSQPDTNFAISAIKVYEPYIKEGTIAHVNSLYPTLSYDEAKCRRDVGYILSAVRADLANNNNAQAIINGQFYYNGVISVLPIEQVQPTVYAIQKAKELTTKAILGRYIETAAPLTVTNIGTLIDTTINIINNGIGSYIPTTFTPTADTEKAIDLLRLNQGYIQDKTIEYLDKQYPDLVYNKQLCYRDVGLILSGVQIDLRNGNNQEAERSGRFYYIGQTGNTLVFPDDQKFPTIIALDEVKRLAQYVVTGIYNDRADIDRCVDTINHIIVNGPNSFTPVTSSIMPGALEGAQNINLNISFIQKEVMGYLNTVYPDLQYDKAKCERDVGFILSAIQIDMQTGSNAEGIRAGQAYYNGMSLYLPNAQIAPTVAAFDYAKRLAKFIARDVPVEGLGAGAGLRVDGNDAEGFLRSFVLDSYTQFNEGGKGIHILNNGYAQLVSIFTICCTEGMLVESGGSCSINTSNCSFGLSGLVARGKSEVAVLTGSLVADPFGTATINVSSAQGTLIYPDSGYYNPAAPIDTRRIAFVPYNGMLYTIGNDPTLYVVDGNPAFDSESNSYVVNTTQTIRTNYEAGLTVRFYIRSTITASAHTFEYIGSGIILASAVPALGGVGSFDNEAVFDNGGVVFFTSTNQAGNFRVGPGFTVVQETGTIEGQVFERSILTLVTPITLALE